ncbi:CENPH protein, partial [Pomatostomus ruficeps]|nr:CENPH protein [Pomatostomus ruficeps]
PNEGAAHGVQHGRSWHATQDLQRDIEEVKVTFHNKTLALQRIQLMNALRNKMHQDGDEDSRLILETIKHMVLLSRTIIEYQQQACQKEQQLIDIKRKRLSLKRDGGQKLQQIQTMMKRQMEKQASVNVTETEKMLDTLEKERQMTTIIQNVFQNIIIGSKVNWAEDPSLKAIVLQLEKNVYLQ